MKFAAKSRLVGIVEQALDRAGLRRGDVILLGLSGGPDSVALLHLLRELQPTAGFQLAGAHLNHRLRGAESDRDEAFVREMCARLPIELNVEQAAGLERGASNLEERARNARYEFFARAARKLGASYVATAHHADDQAETVMLRLLRGSGLAGLGAMAPADRMVFAGPPGEQHALILLRPLLHVRRDEVLSYLGAIGARFVSDSSNGYPGFLRNRVRSELLPALEREYAPGLRRRLAALADEMREADDFIVRHADAELEHRQRDGALLLEGFAGLHPALSAALLRSFLANRIGDLRRISRRHVQGLRRLCLAKSPGASLALPGRWRAVRLYSALIVERAPEAGVSQRSNFETAAAGFCVALGREGTTEVVRARFAFHSSIAAADATPLPDDLYEACFDAEVAAAGLVVRNFMAGDRVMPLGIEGSRKVQDVFVDRKLARARRLSYPVVTFNKQIAWLPGFVRGRVALVTSVTRQVLHVRAREIAEDV